MKKIVASHLGGEEGKITLESSFVDDLGADSLDQVELVMAFEEEFNIDCLLINKSSACTFVYTF